MNPHKAEKLFLLMKQHGVEYFKTLELEIRMGVEIGPVKEPLEPVKAPPKAPRKVPAPQSVPPVEQAIPHHVNEVKNLLKLNDNDLVDKLFPDYTQESLIPGAN